MILFIVKNAEKAFLCGNPIFMLMHELPEKYYKMFFDITSAEKEIRSLMGKVCLFVKALKFIMNCSPLKISY